MSEVLTFDYNGQTPSEYALATWSRMTDQGFTPLDSIRLIEAQLKRRQALQPSGDSDQALQLLDKWRAMIQAVRGRVDSAGDQDSVVLGGAS